MQNDLKKHQPKAASSLWNKTDKQSRTRYVHRYIVHR